MSTERLIDAVCEATIYKNTAPFVVYYSSRPATRDAQYHTNLTCSRLIGNTQPIEQISTTLEKLGEIGVEDLSAFCAVCSSEQPSKIQINDLLSELSPRIIKTIRTTKLHMGDEYTFSDNLVTSLAWYKTILYPALLNYLDRNGLEPSELAKTTLDYAHKILAGGEGKAIHQKYIAAELRSTQLGRRKCCGNCKGMWVELNKDNQETKDGIKIYEHAHQTFTTSEKRWIVIPVSLNPFNVIPTDNSRVAASTAKYLADVAEETHVIGGLDPNKIPSPSTLTNYYNNHVLVLKIPKCAIDLNKYELLDVSGDIPIGDIASALRAGATHKETYYSLVKAFNDARITA